MSVRKFFAVCAIGAAALALAAPGRAANWIEKNIWLSGPNYDADVPLCENGWALWLTQSRFATKESRFWQSDLTITSIDTVRETAFRPGHYALIPRRYCAGVANVSDGTRHKIFYSIGEDTGNSGMSWGIEFCVVGLDRNWAYNPRCKMAQP